MILPLEHILINNSSVSSTTMIPATELRRVAATAPAPQLMPPPRTSPENNICKVGPPVREPSEAQSVSRDDESSTNAQTSTSSLTNT